MNREDSVIVAVVLLGAIANKFASIEIHKFALRNKYIWFLDILMSAIVWMFVFAIAGKYLWPAHPSITLFNQILVNVIGGFVVALIWHMPHSYVGLEHLLKKFKNGYWERHANEMNPFADHYDVAGNFVKGVEQKWFDDYDLDKMTQK